MNTLSLLGKTVHRLPLARCLTSGPDAFTAPLQFLDGKRTEIDRSGQNKELIEVKEPATGKALTSMVAADQAVVDRAIQNSKEAFPVWSSMKGSDRCGVLYRAAQIIRQNLEALSIAEARDSGKPIYEARFDVEGCADAMEYLAGLARNIAGQHIDIGGGSFAYTRREPLGVIGAIGAWNYPFQMAVWKSAAALCCGNTVVFKPSPLTPATTVMLGEIYSEAGMPPGAYNVIQGSANTGALLSSHPDIAKMSFTGSVPTGTKVMEACAKGIKDVLLELGGKSPVIIFEDCNLENAVKGTMAANFFSQGQVCSNGTRVFVERTLYERFVESLVDRVRKIKVGDPFKEDTQMGAMISHEQATRVLDYIQSARDEGATVLIGGESIVPEPSLSGGSYISPCVLTDVRDEMKAVREEIFGPVVCVMPFDTEKEVVSRANNTEFGLAGGVFTKDLVKAHRVAAALQAGNVYINNYNVYPPEMPFGGYKKSGIGRENSALTIDAFTQVKSVIVEMGDVDSPFN